MKYRADFPTTASPKGIEVFQLTTETGVPHCHIYPEAQIFTPDSNRLVLHRNGNPHGGDLCNPQRQYMLCDLSSCGELSPLTDEPGVAAPCISADGQYFYYFVHQLNGTGRLLLKQLSLHTGERSTLHVLEGVIPGTRLRISSISMLSTIRQDGHAIALPVFVGDGGQNPSFGLLVFDLEKRDVRLILHGPSWANVHPQYCRSSDPAFCHDIMVQENHGCVVSSEGKLIRLVGKLGCDIHVVRDDGTNFRTLAWGRDDLEQCRGHQCWRGDSPYAIGSVTVAEGMLHEEIRLMEGTGLAYADHLGKHTPGAGSNEITRSIAKPKFDHFATDKKGDILISDGLYEDGWQLALSRLGKPGEEAIAANRYLIHTKSAANGLPPNLCHPHPFFSPDGGMAFFNSNESGILQAYMIRQLPS